MAASDEAELVRMINTSTEINDRPCAFRYPRGTGLGSILPSLNEKIEIGKFFKKVYGSPKTKIECVEDFIESKDINLNSCLFIGDSKSDLQCANHFDMKFLFIKNEYNKHVIVDEDIPQVENFL